MVVTQSLSIVLLLDVFVAVGVYKLDGIEGLVGEATGLNIGLGSLPCSSVECNGEYETGADNDGHAWKEHTSEEPSLPECHNERAHEGSSTLDGISPVFTSASHQLKLMLKLSCNFVGMCFIKEVTIFLHAKLEIID